MFGKYLEDFQEGDVYRHFPSKTITEGDNNLFSLLTMNHHPVHIDSEYAKNTEHGEILVVGTYVFSLVVGLTVADVSGRAIANLGYENVLHDSPSFIGDTISAETEVLSVRVSRTKSDRGVVYVETRAFNQNGVKVLTFRRNVLIPKKETLVDENE